MLNDDEFQKRKPEFDCEDKNMSLPSTSSFDVWIKNDDFLTKDVVNSDDFNTDVDLLDSALTENFQHVSFLYNAKSWVSYVT